MGCRGKRGEHDLEMADDMAQQSDPVFLPDDDDMIVDEWLDSNEATPFDTSRVVQLQVCRTRHTAPRKLCLRALV